MESMAAIVGVPLHNRGIYLNIPWIDVSQPAEWQKTSFNVDASMVGTTSGQISVKGAPVPLMRKLLETIQEYRKEMEVKA